MRVPDGRASKSLEFVFTTIYVINTLVSSYAFELRVRHGSRLYSMPGYLPPLATCTLPFGMFHLLTYGNRSLGLRCKLLFVLPYAPLYAVRVPANPACCTCARSPMLIYAPCAPVCPIVCVPADPAAPRARDLHASPACSHPKRTFLSDALYRYSIEFHVSPPTPANLDCCTHPLLH